MPIKPSHAPETVRPRQEFTGRKAEKDRFERALRQEQARDEYRILNWYGPGGQGKTWLAREFMRIYRHVRDTESKRAGMRRFAGAQVSFEGTVWHQPDQALLTLRRQLRSAGIAFPGFDLALPATSR